MRARAFYALRLFVFPYFFSLSFSLSSSSFLPLSLFISISPVCKPVREFSSNARNICIRVDKRGATLSVYTRYACKCIYTWMDECLCRFRVAPHHAKIARSPRCFSLRQFWHRRRHVALTFNCLSESLSFRALVGMPNIVVGAFWETNGGVMDAPVISHTWKLSRRLVNLNALFMHKMRHMHFTHK